MTRMKRRSYGRDTGLTLRMLLTTGLLGLLYVVFAVVLFSVLNVGLAPMLLIVVGIAFFQYYTSDKLALAAAGAKVVTADEAPELHQIVERLCAMADLPKPKIAVMDTPVPNAFATGRSPKHAAVCVTTGLWHRLDPKELEAVLAHELSHIAQPRRAGHDRRELLRDARRAAHPLRPLLGHVRRLRRRQPQQQQQRAAGLAVVLAVSIVVYAVSFVLIRTLSRYREYAADRGSALITGAPEYLMSALQKISSQMTLIPQQDLRQVEGMNAYFIIPARAKAFASELFMDHPPIEKRLAALAEIAREMGRPVA